MAVQVSSAAGLGLCWYHMCVTVSCNNLSVLDTPYHAVVVFPHPVRALLLLNKLSLLPEPCRVQTAAHAEKQPWQHPFQRTGHCQDFHCFCGSALPMHLQSCQFQYKLRVSSPEHAHLQSHSAQYLGVPPTASTIPPGTFTQVQTNFARHWMAGCITTCWLWALSPHPLNKNRSKTV